MHLAHRLGGIVPIRVKIGKDVHTAENEIGQEELPEEDEGEEAQSQKSCETAEASAWIAI